jgi:FdhD protein
MPASPAHAPRRIVRWEGAQAAAIDDAVAVEEPLEIRVAGRAVAVVMRTPGHDRELAAGFLVTEGILRSRDDLLDLVRCRAVEKGEPPENIIDAVLRPEANVDWTRLTRHVFTSSSCGICSKASIEAVRARCAPLAGRMTPRRAVILALPAALREAQGTFAATGGVHCCALFSVDGGLELAREDVGRHNALDKVIGRVFLDSGLPLSERILMVSGRVSFEIVQKALAAGIGCIAAVSAPTSAAVELAAETGLTLIGFVRGERLNVYAGTLAE